MNKRGRKRPYTEKYDDLHVIVLRWYTTVYGVHNIRPGLSTTTAPSPIRRASYRRRRQRRRFDHPRSGFRQRRRIRLRI